MVLNKNLNIQPNIHRINTWSSSIYDANNCKAMKKMYSFFLLEATDEWHKKQIMYEATQL